MSLAYARAQRDLACVYSLGFYDRNDGKNRVRGLDVRVKRPGIQAIHPSKYTFRSAEERRESLVRAAFFSPDSFEAGAMRAHLFPLRPVSKKSWEGLLAISFPVALAETAGGPAEREFGAVLNRGAKLAHRFSRRITLQPDHAGVTSEPRITFLERVVLAPGTYTLSVVLSGASADSPNAAKIEITVPEVPSKELLLVRPILGRPAGTNVVVLGGDDKTSGDDVGSSNSFEPLLVQQVDEPVDLLALTQACYVGSRKKYSSPRAAGPSIARALRQEDGEELGELPSVSLELEGEGDVRCQSLLDRVPDGSLADGEYVFQASLEGVDGGGSESVRFAVSRPRSPTMAGPPVDGGSGP